MSYAGKYLKAKGQDCIINKTPAITTKVSIKQLTKSANNLGNREALREGLVLKTAGALSGDILTINTEKYIVQSINEDFASSEDAFFAAKCNAILVHKRLGESADTKGNVVQQWNIVNSNVNGYGEIITYTLRQYDPGLLPQTRYIFQVPKNLGIVELDRIIYGDGNNNTYKVESIDDIALKGVVRMQLSKDTRP